ncbi:CVNH domain-containing protein [Vibrio quintilis]|uniref:Cyanovirin-N domain-containing protein n=1 Tax=Vibrio quintilis TaxID=1117707 RepID=A0A1M7YVG3_9VIBR|nr:CVNH domain-containing protein [Vibrio quintilis]SHO56649.1 hypothetical protein VQ7734_02418 [Vibrio quintilis]
MSNIPPGSYEETSKDIHFEGTPGKTDCYLIATCKKSDGSWIESRLKYNIANLNGELKWAPNEH